MGGSANNENGSEMGVALPQQEPVQRQDFDPLQDIFTRSQQQASSQNMMFGILGALASNSPAPFLQALQKNNAIKSSSPFAAKLFETEEFKKIDPQFQSIVAQHAGSGDLDNAYQYLNAGRLSRERQDELKYQQSLGQVAKQFGANPANDKAFQNYFNKLNEKHPQAAATLAQTYGKSERSERRQQLQDVGQAASAGLDELKKKDVGPVVENKKLFGNILAQNPNENDLQLSVEEFAARFGISNKEAMRAKSLLAENARKTNLGPSQGIWANVRDFFGFGTGFEGDPTAALQSAQNVGLSEEALAAQEQIESERNRLQGIKSESERAQAREGFLTPGLATPTRPNQPPSPQKKMVLVEKDGKKFNIPAENLPKAVKRGAKLVGK